MKRRKLSFDDGLSKRTMRWGKIGAKVTYPHLFGNSKLQKKEQGGEGGDWVNQ